jgi:hypothetical protein
MGDESDRLHHVLGQQLIRRDGVPFEVAASPIGLQAVAPIRTMSLRLSNAL